MNREQPYEILKKLLTSPKTTHIKLLGDSITHGMGGTGFAENGYAFIEGFARNPDGHCWANRFQKYLQSHFDCTVTNNACSGTNIEFIIRHFDTLVDGQDDLILCTIGTNDRHFCFDEGVRPTREEMGRKFYNNVRTLHGLFRAANKEVIFVANIPASASNERDGDHYWRILHMADIDFLYKKASEECGFSLISLYDLFHEYCNRNDLEPASLLADGLHPNDRGYDVIYQLLIDALRL